MKLLSRAAGVLIAGAMLGYACRKMKCYRDHMFDKKLVEQELQVLEGEGGVCLS